MAGGFTSIGYTDSFKRDYKRLDPPQQEEVDLCITDLLLPVIPALRRFHCVDKRKPKIYTADVYSNKSYKISVNVDGAELILRRVGTHKAIDDNP